MEIYYYIKQAYQFSYALPLYNKYGGKIITKQWKKKWQSKFFLKNINQPQHKKTFLNSPEVILHGNNDLTGFKGIIVLFSNAKIRVNPEYCTTIFIGHGTGDKRYGGNLTGPENLLRFDYIFLSGDKHVQRLIDSNLQFPEEKMIKIGNIRFDDYINDKIDVDKVYNTLGVVDRSRKTVLYAPTWRFGNGTFHLYAKKFAREITKDFNLIIRPHYHDAKHIKYMKIWAKINGIKHLYFSNPSHIATNDTMFDMKVSDILISETSSVLYEYLITNKPIIVIENGYQKLHKMPDNMNIMTQVDMWNGKSDINELIHENINEQKYSKAYKKMLKDCFYHNDGTSLDKACKFIEDEYKKLKK